MKRAQLIALAGSATLFVGVFAPLISIPFLGNINYFNNGRGDGVIVLVLAAVSLTLAAVNKCALLWFTGSGALAAIVFTFVSFQIRFSRISAEMEKDLEGNLFAGLGKLAVQSVQMQWGWAVLVIGSLTILAAAYLDNRDDPNSRPNVRFGLISASSIVGLAVVLSLIVGDRMNWAQDNLSRPSASPKLAADTASGKTKGWNVSEGTNEMDGTKIVTLYLEAETEVTRTFGSSRPHLMIRCRQNQTDVFVNVETQIQNEYGSYSTASVRVKFDNGAPAKERWTEATSGDALFAPRPVQLARQLATTETFLFEFTPFQRATETVRFDVRGLGEHLGKVSSACAWAEIESRRKQAEEKQTRELRAENCHMLQPKMALDTCLNRYEELFCAGRKGCPY